MTKKSQVVPRYKIKLAPDIFEINGDGESTVTLTVTRNAAQPESTRFQDKGINSPWEKDR